MSKIQWRILLVAAGIFSLSTACDFLSNLMSDSAPNNEADDTSKAATEEQLSSAAAKNAKANAEILREIFQVTYMREPKDRSEFGNWADTLNQGASLEGIYNGLIRMAEYKKLEAAASGASAEAVRIFGEELAVLEAELPTPTQLEYGTSTQPSPDSTPPSPAPVSLGKPEPTETPKPDISGLAAKYSKQFVGASIYTLKRVIGDEALKVIETKSAFREKLAVWYSKWVVHMTERNIDFGVALRNKADEAFHYKWVLSSTDDRVRWEVLNRLHRVLNEANRSKQ